VRVLVYTGCRFNFYDHRQRLSTLRSSRNRSKEPPNGSIRIPRSGSAETQLPDEC
jgi:hypothetical protein